MKFKNLIVFFIAIVILHACKSTEEIQIEKIVAEYNIKFKSKDVLFLVPVGGCNPCIKDVINYLKRNPEYKAIIVGMGKKEINRFLNDSIYNNKNIIIDSKGNILKYNDLISSSPLVCYFKNNNFAKLQYINTENSEARYAELEKFLK